MSVDLLRQQPRWKEALVSLREMMTSLIQQVHSFVNGLVWVSFSATFCQVAGSSSFASVEHDMHHQALPLMRPY